MKINLDSVMDALQNIELPTPLIWKIVEYLPKEALLNARMVNHAWNAAVCPRIGYEFSFKMDGQLETLDELTTKVQVLLNSESAIQWYYLELHNLDFGDIRIPTLLVPVGEKFSTSCTSITLNNCYEMTMIDFILTIAQAQRLLHLRVEECPSILSAGINVIEYWQQMQAFLRNMKKLKSLQFINSSEHKNLASTMETWLHETYQLETLGLYTPVTLPSYVLAGMFRRNSETLTSFSIRSYSFDERTLQMISLIACPHLKHLQFQRCTVDNPTLFSVFLQRQFALEILYFQNMVISNEILYFLEIGGAQKVKLKEIAFSFCTFHSVGSLNPLKKCESLSRISVTGDDRSAAICRAVLMSRSSAEQQFGIQSLEFGIKSGLESPNNDWIQYIPHVFPNLSILRLNDLKGVDYRCFRSLFGLSWLRELSLARCNIPEDFFLPGLEDMPAFNEIRSLDLTGTDILDVHVFILVMMENLEYLNLESTLVTKECMFAIRDFKPGQLEYLNIRNFDDRPFSVAEYFHNLDTYFREGATFIADCEPEEGEFELEHGVEIEEIYDWEDDEDGDGFEMMPYDTYIS